MANRGWIKLDRSIMQHWIFQDAEYLRAWLTILMMTNHEETTVLINRTPKKIPAGSFFSSISALAKAFGWDRRTTTRFIEALEKEQMLTTERTTTGTAFSVVNWAKYQGQRTTGCTTEYTAPRTTQRTTGCTQTRMEKNDKEWKEGAQARAREKAPAVIKPNQFNTGIYERKDIDWDAFARENDALGLL